MNSWTANTIPPQSTTPGLYSVSIHQMAPPERTSNCSSLLIYWPRKDERLSWPSWLTCSGWFTHITGHLSDAGRAQNRESSPAKGRRSSTVPHHQLLCVEWNVDLYPLTHSVLREWLSSDEWHVRVMSVVGVLQAFTVRESLDGRRTECDVHQLERTAAVKHEVDEVSCCCHSVHCCSEHCCCCCFCCCCGYEEDITKLIYEEFIHVFLLMSCFYSARVWGQPVLLVRQRIHFKLGCLMYKSLSGQAPQYLADDVQLVADSGRRRLQSASDRTCVVPRTHNSFGDRSFSAAGPRVWNALPPELRHDISFGLFRCKLKSHLFV